MKTRMFLAAALCLGCAIAWQAARADEIELVRHRSSSTVCPTSCPPGCHVCEEVCYRETFRNVCKVVPETRKIKKWVYCCEPEPFCIKNTGPAPRQRLFPLFGHRGGDDCAKPCDSGCAKCGGKGCAKETVIACPKCEGPFCRNQLIKREVVVEEVCDFKCVVEKVCDKVAYKVYHTLPCDQPVPPGMTVIPPEQLSAPPMRMPNVEQLKTPPDVINKKL